MVISAYETDILTQYDVWMLAMGFNGKSPTQQARPLKNQSSVSPASHTVRKVPFSGEPRMMLRTRIATKMSEAPNLDLIHSLQVSNMEWWQNNSNYIKLSALFWDWACGCRAPAVSPVS